jgi:hypothetical protein
LLATLGDERLDPRQGELPSAVLALASFVRAEDGATGGHVVTVPGREGWITLHASKPEPSGRRVAIVIEPASGPRAATRQELVARVFLDEYLPEVGRRTPLTSHGRFELD